jgi:lysophospholipase L1-like esterase
MTGDRARARHAAGLLGLLVALVAGGCSVKPKEEARASADKSSAHGKVVRVWPLGDSITLGANGGYRNGVFRELSTLGYRLDMIGTQHDKWSEIDDKDHEGHPGLTIGDIDRELAGWMQALPKPDLVLLMAGTNDIAWWYNEQPSETASRALALASKLLERLPEATVAVASIPPMSPKITEPKKTDRSQAAAEFNAHLKTGVQKHPEGGKRLLFADAGGALTLGDLYDGIHPTREAHDKIARAWIGAVKGALVRKAKSH